MSKYEGKNEHKNEYKITFHKYPHFLTSEEHKTFLLDLGISDTCAEENLNRDLRTLGTFDRMTLEKIDKFSRSRDFSPYAKKWNGDNLSLLLYDIEENSLFKMGMEVDEESENHLCYFPFEKGSFVTLSFFSLSDLLMIEKGCDYGTFLCELKEKIEEYIPKTETLSYTLLGSFGLSDFCLLGLTKDYSEVLNAVERLKSLKIRMGKQETALFSGFYTVFSLNRQENDSTEIWKNSLKALHGKVDVLLSTRQGSGIEIFQKELKKRYSAWEQRKLKLRSIAGEYDLILTGPAKLLLPQIQRDGFLHFSDEFYQEHIRCSQIQLLAKSTRQKENGVWEFKEGYFRLLSQDLIFEKEKALRTKIEGSSEQDGLRAKIKSAFFKLSCFADDFDAFYHDLRGYLFSQARLQRRLDCAERFETILEIMEDKLDRINDERNEDNYQSYCWEEQDEIRLLVKALHTQLSQERELSVLALDAPLCQGNYNGHQDLLLHTYNNYLKGILALIYELRGDEQQRICPLITSSTTFQVRSTQFSANNNGKSISLVKYDLPTAVMIDIPFGITSILHETFHYVLPGSRERRNILTAVPFLCELTLRYLCSHLAERMVETKRVERVASSLVDTMMRQCKNSQNYNNYMQRMQQYIKQFHSTIFAPENLGNYFDTFCDALTAQIQSAEPCPGPNADSEEGLFFDHCLKIAEDELFPLLSSNEYIIEDVVYSAENSWATSIREEVCNQLKTTGSFFLEYWVDIYRDELLEPCREIKADIGMLATTGMTELDYLLFFTTLLHIVKGKTCVLSEGDGFRLYCVTEFLRAATDTSYDQSKDKRKSEFVERYVSRFFSNKSGEQKNRQEINDTINMAIQYWDHINEIIEDSRRYYSVYSPLLKVVADCYDPRCSMENWTGRGIVEVSSEYFGDCRKNELQYYKELAFVLCQVDRKDADFTTCCRNYQSSVFNAALRFIHGMQNTCLLSELEDNIGANITANITEKESECPPGVASEISFEETHKEQPNKQNEAWRRGYKVFHSDKEYIESHRKILAHPYGDERCETEVWLIWVDKPDNTPLYVKSLMSPPFISNLFGLPDKSGLLYKCIQNQSQNEEGNSFSLEKFLDPNKKGMANTLCLCKDVRNCVNEVATAIENSNKDGYLFLFSPHRYLQIVDASIGKMDDRENVLINYAGEAQVAGLIRSLLEDQSKMKLKSGMNQGDYENYWPFLYGEITERNLNNFPFSHTANDSSLKLHPTEFPVPVKILKEGTEEGYLLYNTCILTEIYKKAKPVSLEQLCEFYWNYDLGNKYKTPFCYMFEVEKKDKKYLIEEIKNLK